jgi:hypothetical protein
MGREISCPVPLVKTRDFGMTGPLGKCGPRLLYRVYCIRVERRAEVKSTGNEARKAATETLESGLRNTSRLALPPEIAKML